MYQRSMRHCNDFDGLCFERHVLAVLVYWYGPRRV